MAIAFDGKASGDSGAGTSTSLSWSHTVTDATNGLAIVAVAIANRGTSVLSALSFGPTSILANLIQSAESSAGWWIGQYYALPPTAGTQTVSATLSLGRRSAGVSHSFTGVHQSGGASTFGNTVATSGNSTTAAITIGSASGELIVDALNKRDTTEAPTADAGQGNVQQDNTTSATDNLNTQVGASTEAGAASVATQWTWSTTRGWAYCAVAIKPTASAVFVPIVGRGPGMALAGPGGLAGGY